MKSIHNFDESFVEIDNGFSYTQREEIISMIEYAIKKHGLKNELCELKKNNELNIFKSYDLLLQIIVLIFMAFLFGIFTGAVML